MPALWQSRRVSGGTLLSVLVLPALVTRFIQGAQAEPRRRGYVFVDAKSRCHYGEATGRPTMNQVVEIMRVSEMGLDQGGGTTTIPRRAQTVLAWVD